MTLQAELMAILDATVAHLVGTVSQGTLLKYKMVALYWYHQEGQAMRDGLAWFILPNGHRQCVVQGEPWVDEQGAPLTLEALRVYEP